MKPYAFQYVCQQSLFHQFGKAKILKILFALSVFIRIFLMNDNTMPISVALLAGFHSYNPLAIEKLLH